MEPSLVLIIPWANQCFAMSTRLCDATYESLCDTTYEGSTVQLVNSTQLFM